MRINQALLLGNRYDVYGVNEFGEAELVYEFLSPLEIVTGASELGLDVDAVIAAMDMEVDAVCELGLGYSIQRGA